MKKLTSTGAIFALFLTTFFASGCGFGKIKAEENSVAATNETKVESPRNENANSPRTKKQTLNASSVVGTYNYDTEKDGEGYDNSLEVTKADDGKLFIYISGSYIYKIDETQTFKEAEGKGDARLRGNRADATLVDEAGKPCRATIVFRGDTANVKIPETCQFNIALGGVYKKVESKPQKQSLTENEKSNLREVGYEKVMDFINDFAAHNVGEEYVIKNVPSEILDKKTRMDQFGNASYKGLFSLEGVTDDDSVSYSVTTSRKMLESLAKNAEYEPVILRMTALTIESKGKFDVYRMPFVTKIEGLDSEGETIWKAEAGKPAKLYFTR